MPIKKTTLLLSESSTFPNPGIVGSEVVLDVPYISQEEIGATKYKNDCGPASAMMLLKAYFKDMNLTVDEFYKYVTKWITVGDPDPKLSYLALQDGMRQLGLETNFTKSLTRGDAFMALSSGKPLIIGVTYGILVNAGLTQHRGFVDGHWMVMKGMTLSHAICADPYRTDGKTETWIPHNILESAMGYIEGSAMSARTAIIPVVEMGKIIDANAPGVLYKVKPIQQINVRSSPFVPPADQTMSNFVTTVCTNDTLSVLNDSDKDWYQIGKNQYVKKYLCRRIP